MSFRVILAVPENNTTVNEEVRAYCPEFTDVRLARVPRPHRPLTRDDLPVYRQSTLDTVRPLIGDGVDLVIYGCTSAGFLAGPSGNDAFVQALSDLTGAPVVSTSDAMIAALKSSRARAVDLVSPYIGWKNAALVSYLKDYDIAVLNASSFEAQNPSELGRIQADEVFKRALPVVSDASDALFIACTQLPTRPIIDRLRQEIGKPVWSATLATAWAALRQTGSDADRLARAA